MQNHFKKIITTLITLEARLVQKRYYPTVVAVTGSIGKTSTKDGLFTMLTEFVHVRKSQKSFNSDTGVPLSILGLPNAWTNPVLWVWNLIRGASQIIYTQYPKWLVLEVGADKPNDIRDVAKWLKPNIVVITKFPEIMAHIEFFESRDAVINEKASLAEALSKDGLLILNADDADVLALRNRVLCRTLTYGVSKEATVRLVSKELLYAPRDGAVFPSGIKLEVDVAGTHVTLMIDGALGDSHSMVVLASLALAYGRNFDIFRAARALERYATPPGRLSLIDGRNQSLIIDDTYNSSPEAAIHALGILKSLKTKGRKIAVLGDMLELGKLAVEAHKGVGKVAADSVDMLITVGIRATHIAENAFMFGLGKDKVIEARDAYQAGEIVREMLSIGDIVLVKASQGIRLERTVEMLMAKPEEAKERLVRQEREWKKR